MNLDTLFATVAPLPVIVGTGLVALDVILDEDDSVRAPYLQAGGTCGNVLAILSYLGWRAFPVARLNGDLAAQHVQRDLARCGVALDFAHLSPGSATPIFIQRTRRNAKETPSHTFLRVCPVCSRRLPSYQPVPLSAVEEVAARMELPAVFFLDRVSPGALVLAKASKEQGAVIVFEPVSIGDPRLFYEALSLAHIVKYSHERIERLDDVGVTPLLEIQTLGREGLRYRSKIQSARISEWRHLASYDVAHIADSAGAGDWCTAGVVHALGQTGSQGLLQSDMPRIREALRFGQALAAWSCEFKGARGGMYAGDKKTLRRAIERITAGMIDYEWNQSELHQATLPVLTDMCLMCSMS